MIRYDAIVVGGGVAGTAVGIQLARAGRRVVLLERETGPHDKVCGEFISREGISYLDRLGVSFGNLNSVSISNVRIVNDGAPVTYPLPFTARSLSRRCLDNSLLDLAVKAGVEVHRDTRVKELTQSDGGWTVVTGDGSEYDAPDAFLATGKHDLRGWKRPPGTQNDLIGLKSYWRLADEQTDALRDHVELILFPGGYAGLQLIEGGFANLCLLVRQSVFAGRYKTYDRLIADMIVACPHLRARLRMAIVQQGRPLAITGLPYGYVNRAPGPDGLWRLGDQAAVIPSFSGDGMSIALHSAQLASRAYLNGGIATEYHRALEKDVGRQVGRATTISKILVNPSGQRLAMAAAYLIPSILKATATVTRITNSALLANAK